MKSMLMAIMAVAVAVTFSAPAFAERRRRRTRRRAATSLCTVEEKDKKKDGKYTDTFGEEKDKKGGHSLIPSVKRRRKTRRASNPFSWARLVSLRGLLPKAGGPFGAFSTCYDFEDRPLVILQSTLHP